VNRKRELLAAITAATACAQAGMLDRAREWLEIAVYGEAQEQ